MAKNFRFSVPENQVNFYDLQEIAGRNKLSLEDAIKMSWNGFNQLQKLAETHVIYIKINGEDVPLNLNDFERT